MLTIRNDGGRVAAAVVAELNLLKRHIVANDETYPHVDVTSTTGGDYLMPVATPLLASSASATTLGTTITRTENIRTVLLVHAAEGGSAANGYSGAHKAADSTFALAIAVVTVPTATDQGTVNTALNAFKAAWNIHLASTTAHFTADATYTVATPDATNLGTSETLANALYTAVNGHIQFASGGHTIRLGAA